MDNRQVRAMKLVLLASSLATVTILLLAAYNENFRGEWRSAQKAYKALLITNASDDNARRAAASFAVEHKQLFLPELNEIDRCTTCHLGAENPAMVDAEQPLKKHTGDILVHHPVDKFGCTICHSGQGRAINKEQAHGWQQDGTLVAHTEAPLLRGKTVYTSCGKCHYESDLYGGLEDLHAGAAQSDRSRGTSTLNEQHLTVSLPGADDVSQGKRLLIESGCLGCHKYRGRGGVLGPDITYVGEKTKHDFDFSHVEGEHTVERWLFEHFMFPEEVSPGTLMPDMGYSEEQARVLTRYMMSLHRKTAPASHRPRPILASAERVPIRGETLYDMFCAACHGSEGLGSTMRTGLWPTDADPWGHNWDARDIVIEERADLDVYVPSLNHADTLAIASETYLRAVIANGRPGTKMIGWETEGGLSADEITLLTSYIRSWQPQGAVASEVSSARGEPRVGNALYRANCAACHGFNGEGGIGASLNSPTFLAVASDAFLRDTILHGRPDTAMPAWREFNAQEVSDLLAFMRQQWQPTAGELADALKLCEGDDNDDVSAAIGKTLFKANCVMCHGADGQGDLGPTLNTPEFLSVVPNDYLLNTLVDGRPGTAMPSWRHLSDQDLASIVRHLRTWQNTEGKTDDWRAEFVERGDEQAGRIHFVSHCAGCHGSDAEGGVGPQLSNPQFLEIASDRMLFEWIANGKSGTEMRSFRKGGQGIAELGKRHLEDIVAYLRSLQYASEDDINRVAKSPHGRPEKGAELYEFNCSGCHGLQGEGASGPALSNPNFLRYASDGFLMATMALGRSGTEMRPVKAGPQSILGLTSDEVNDVVAYLRSWEYNSPFASAEGEVVAHRFVIPWDFEAGRQLYVSNCSGCHGIEGKGSWGPELNNEGFLAAATDGFLQATIVKGRKATAMRPFGTGAHGLVDLTSDDIDNIVAYMRAWSLQTPSPMTIPAEKSLQQPSEEASEVTSRSSAPSNSEDEGHKPIAANTAHRQGDPR